VDFCPTNLRSHQVHLPSCPCPSYGNRMSALAAEGQKLIKRNCSGNAAFNFQGGLEGRKGLIRKVDRVDRDCRKR
jgi:hypothetical protein